MSYSTKPFETSSHTDGASSTRMQGIWLLLARVAWCVVTATVLVIYVGGMPARIARVLDPRLLEPLDLGGLTINFSLTYIVAVELLVALTFVAVASIIFWRKFGDGAAILVALLLLSYAPGEMDFTDALVHTNSAWHWPVNTLRALGEVLSLVVFYIFPNGRFVPRWTRYAAFIYSGVVLVWLLNKDLPFNVLYGPVHPLTLLIALSIHSTGVFALAYRYRYLATRVEKQQMKWAVFGLIIAFLFSVFRYSFDAILRISGDRYEVFWYILYNMIVEPISWLGLTAAPVCICVALLRRRLWDIDPIINRALVYGSLTAAIVSIYVAVVGTFSALLSVNSTILLTLIGTGLIAVLVQPLRDFLQHAVNRLMYGERDDPYVVLARLGKHSEAGSVIRFSRFVHDHVWHRRG